MTKKIAVLVNEDTMVAILPRKSSLSRKKVLLRYIFLRVRVVKMKIMKASQSSAQRQALM